MNRRRRLAFIFVSVFLLAAVMALPAIATEDTGEATDDTVAETVEPPDPVVTDIEPVVVVTTPTAEAVTADWTYRYLIPTGLGLIVLIILITTARYFTDVVRKRYRIVEE